MSNLCMCHTDDVCVWCEQENEIKRLREALNEIKITKYKKGEPTVIDWNGQRWVRDAGTTFRGGVKRGKTAHKT